MKKIYFLVAYLVCCATSVKTFAQDCALLTADFAVFESRCSATGAIKINVHGGSGTYKYKVTGPVNYNFTSTDSITGLRPGSYTIEINDVNWDCTLIKDNIVVGGDYADPRFTLATDNAFCDNGASGIIRVENLEFGRNPMTFSIVNPSPMGIGISNSTGVFNDLIPGDYSIRLTDSCGGIQTRTVSVQNYTWQIDGYDFTKISCDAVNGWIRVKDSRGNMSNTTGIAGMQYGYLLDGTTDTIWSASPDFSFTVAPSTGSVKAFAKDACGNVKGIAGEFSFYPSLNNNVAITNKQCASFSASVTGLKNFFSPTFCLYDEFGAELFCNNSGVFDGLPYGSYCIKATDLCADTVIERCFTLNPLVPSVGAEVDITNKTCSTFDAAVTGKKDLVDPTFVLSPKGSYSPLQTNSTGIFTNIAYGDYCIYTTDDCGSFITPVCFSVGQPLPKVPDVVVPSYVTCNNFGLEFHADSVYNPEYCLLDADGNVIDCNNTGIFDNIPLGSYCVTIHDECRDTTIERCFLVGPPEAINDMSVTLENKTCSTFTAHVYTTRLAGSEFFLYDQDDQLVGQNTTGIFDGLAYGDYCVKTKPECPDTTLVTCFTATAPVPAIGSTVQVSDKICASFTATAIGMANLTNPVYYLTDAVGDTLSSNSTGEFTGLAYGSYCIKAQDGCSDTTLEVCFTEAPPVFELTTTVSASCNYGNTKIQVSVNTYPATISIYDPTDLLVYSGVINSSTTVDNLPVLADGLQYKVVAESDCSVTDVNLVSPVITWLRHGGNVIQQCPGGVWLSGSGNINVVANSNAGIPTVRIIKKDAVYYVNALQPNLVQFDTVFVFQDLGPATYVVRYTTNDGCSKTFYDTITIKPYAYPNLDKSTAFQCDVNGFSVGAVVSDGLGPFTYEIIGSDPATPSILQGPQSDPVFNIDNGNTYSLIRLRALDACGNGTLGDASVLPLALTGLKVSENCIGLQSRLSVDEILNGTVRWYYQKSKSDPDSTYLGEGFELIFNPLIEEETGFYYALLEMNNGCVTRSYEFNLSGDCYPVLPVMNIEFSGRMDNGEALLNWSLSDNAGIGAIVVERNSGSGYERIGMVDVKDFVAPGQYRFLDKNPQKDNYYRLRIVSASGKDVFSKVVYLRNESAASVRIYPNPANSFVKVEFLNKGNHPMMLELYTITGQQILKKVNVTGSQYTIVRKSSMAPGVYILTVTDQQTGERSNYKIIFK